MIKVVRGKCLMGFSKAETTIRREEKQETEDRGFSELLHQKEELLGLDWRKIHGKEGIKRS